MKEYHKIRWNIWCNLFFMIILALLWFWLFKFYDMVWKNLENKKSETQQIIEIMSWIDYELHKQNNIIISTLESIENKIK
jgi:hypothetical protein